MPGSDPSVASLTNVAASWMADALNAWLDDDYRKVGVLAPLAVEHLGKAALWAANPVLLIPLMQEAEPSLLILAVKPDLANPKLRTVGLNQVLLRLEQLIGGLPIDAERRKRMVGVRNGAVHVGTPVQSRHVLSDALAVCGLLLQRLLIDPRGFYADHYDSVVTLLDQSRTEIGHRVATKRAKARARLRALETELGEDLFGELTGRREQEAVDNLDPADYGHGLLAVNHQCPECGSDGRLFGEVDVDPDVDFDVEPDGSGGWDSSPYVAGWFVTLLPHAFACNVCELSLTGPAELSEGTVPATRIDVEASDLGDDFDPAEFSERMYGRHD
jgi:hypothetical protein